MNETILKKLREISKVGLTEAITPSEAVIILGALGYPKRPTATIADLKLRAATQKYGILGVMPVQIEVLLDYIEQLEENQ